MNTGINLEKPLSDWDFVHPQFLQKLYLEIVLKGELRKAGPPVTMGKRGLALVFGTWVRLFLEDPNIVVFLLVSPHKRCSLKTATPSCFSGMAYGCAFQRGTLSGWVGNINPHVIAVHQKNPAIHVCIYIYIYIYIFLTDKIV